MPDTDPKSLIQRRRRADERRSQWVEHWRECYTYALPQRDNVIQPGQPGEKKMSRLFDATAPDAVDQLAASLLAELTPPWSRWFAFQLGRDAPDAHRAEMAEALERAASILHGHFDRSNFAVEMLLDPTDVTESRLDPDRLHYYTGELDYREGNGQPVLTLGGRRLVSASCFWDPSYGRPDGGPNKSDGCVIACVFTDEDGDYWLHAVEYLTHAPDRVAEIDEATQLCRQAAGFVRRHSLPAVAVEINGIGRFLPNLLRREVRRAGIAAAVIEHANRRAKRDRILDAFDAVLAAGRLHASARVFASPFVREMRDWRPEGSGPDDGLDAVAGCLLVEPVRLSRGPSVTERRDRGRWRPGAEPVAAAIEFEV